jgi:DNA-binding PucR family transcriptional regulator
VLTVVAPAVGQRLALRRLELERDARQRTSLLGELLHGEPSEATRRRAVDLGWQLDGWHTGIRIGVDGQVDVAGRRTDVVEAFDAEGLQAVVVEQGDGWSAWITAAREPTSTEVQQQAAAIRRVQRHLVQTVDAYVGVGRVQPGPIGIATSLAEAGDAAGLARGRPETGRFLHVDRLGLAQLLLAWTRTDTFQPAARALLAPIQDQPGDLVGTLAAYLDTESSLAETAAVLGIHRNTVSARITKIQQLLGVDLANSDERLALHLACRTARD